MVDFMDNEKITTKGSEKKKINKNMNSKLAVFLLCIALIIILIVWFSILFTSNHWTLGGKLFSIGIGILIISIVFRKLEFTLKLKKIFGVIFSIFITAIIIISIGGAIFHNKYDVTYSVKIDVNANISGDYSLIIPVPSDKDGDPLLKEEYPENSDFVKTEYGIGLTINHSYNYHIDITGSRGEFFIYGFSMSVYDYGQDFGCYDYMVYSNLSKEKLSLEISISFDNDGFESGKNGEISYKVNENGWKTVSGFLGHWVT